MGVADFAPCTHRRIEGPERELLKLCAHLSGEPEGKVGLRFDARVSLAMIVVHFVRVEAVQQACEVIEAMAVVAANTAVESERDAAGVILGAQRAKQIFTLRENGNGGGENAARVSGLVRRQHEVGGLTGSRMPAPFRVRRSSAFEERESGHGDESF